MRRQAPHIDHGQSLHVLSRSSYSSTRRSQRLINISRPAFIKRSRNAGVLHEEIGFGDAGCWREAEEERRESVE